MVALFKLNHVGCVLNRLCQGQTAKGCDAFQLLSDVCSQDASSAQGRVHALTIKDVEHLCSFVGENQL